MSDQNSDTDISREQLEELQGSNLMFLEEYTSKSMKICGVPVLMPLVYDFIQVINNLSLQNILEQ